MNSTTTDIFEFLSHSPNPAIERIEITSTGFRRLRQNLWWMSMKLLETEEEQAIDAANQLRAKIAEWLTTPVSFSDHMGHAISSVVGSVIVARNRWGSDFGDLYEDSLMLIEYLQNNENPLISRLLDEICELIYEERTFKIYCDRKTWPLFSEIADGQISEEFNHLNSVSAYRKADLFDVLLKVGPLRARGWGAIPDAVVTAPKFQHLKHFVWAGCSDASDFGYDPVFSDSQQSPYTPSTETPNLGMAISVETVGENQSEYFSSPIISGFPTYDVDELEVLANRNQEVELRQATLIQVDSEHGVLFPPHGRIPSFDPNQDNNDAIAFRTAVDELEEGMFIVLFDRLDYDLGACQASPGHFSSLWREKLKQEWQTSPEILENRLKEAGLDLLRLDLAISHWIRSPDSVIHAPQSKDHFRILLQSLGFDYEVEIEGRAKPMSFIKLAWNEVRLSRGEAIQAGFHGHEIVEKELIGILGSFVERIKSISSAEDAFWIEIPRDSGINGQFRFLKILGVEHGFRVPNSTLKTVQDLNQIDQWRS